MRIFYIRIDGAIQERPHFLERLALNGNIEIDADRFPITPTSMSIAEERAFHSGGK